MERQICDKLIVRTLKPVARDVRNIKIGTLLISDDKATIELRGSWSLESIFGRSKNAQIEVIVVEAIRSVHYGESNKDSMNHWIEVKYGDTDDPKIVYISDGGWRCWRQSLTTSIGKLLKELRALVRPQSH